MKISREWATPITAGAFLLSSTTGILMFFHLETSLNKLAHEWLGWVMLFGALLHLFVNFTAFKKYLKMKKSRALLITFAAVLALSFFPVDEKKKEPPFMAPLNVLAKTPLSNLSTISELNFQQISERLTKEGIVVKSESESVDDLVGDDFKKKLHILKLIMAE